MLKQLILIRHGDYGGDGSLTCEGKRQVENLSEMLRSIVIEPVNVFASPTPRTRETAAIIAGSVAPQPFEATIWDILADGEVDDGSDPFYSDELLYEKAEDASREAATLILVTHEPVCHGFLDYYMHQKYANAKVRVGLGYAEAVVISCETGAYSVIRHFDGTVIVEKHSPRVT